MMQPSEFKIVFHYLLPTCSSQVNLGHVANLHDEERMFRLNDAMWLIIAILQIGQILSRNDISREWKEIVSLNACCRFGHMTHEIISIALYTWSILKPGRNKKIQ